ncbi:ATP-binding protein [Paenibacillus segetis]|uniref:histidine kinase n=1 Tax=Paenibacillus segetis TaxID=1325360 RepID=A0ABQ1YNF2_9BACL|nr:ATP-binding protein [Paenibacillus segetis]GGH30606.1 two-component sensor histidine kinase [Paenibacillus segetis]
MFETLLLNFLFLLFPVVIFLIFFENSTHSYNYRMIVLLSAVAMSLCIAKPIKLEIGFIFDLRYIPFIIVALFGGYRHALPLYFILNIARLYVGGDGTIRSFLFSTAIMMIVPLFSKKFLKLNHKGRILSATAISFTVIGIYLVTLSLTQGTLDRQFWILTLNALTTYTGVMSTIMILIEKIIANIKNRDRIMQSERLNVVSQLAASVSHEIRNPLTVTSGFLQLLNKSRTITPKEKEYVDLSLQELNRAEKIVSDYLSFAKPQSENVIYSNMSVEFEYTKNIIIPYASAHNVEVKFSFSNSLNKSYERSQLQQCLINLYKNGIEAMKDKGGGTLFIDISERKQDIVIRIQDIGIGMTKEEISRLGKPYYSTKEEGTGLGMLMVYSTINKMNGSIEVDSEKGKGTTFLITIPT